MGKGPEKAPITEQQRALAGIAAEQYNNYMTTYRPFEEKYVTDVMGDTSSRKAKVTGRASADVAQAAGTAIKPGVDPASGAAFGSVANTALGTAKSKAIVRGKQAVDNQQINAMQGVVNMGQGKAATTQAGMSALASSAANTAINDLQSEVNGDAFTRNAIGYAIGGVAHYAKKGYGRKPAGDLSDFGTYTEGQAAAINGASPGAGGYSYDKNSGNFNWND
ncbi:MAG TPA: hypothetical protein DCZ75_06440 [Geobacter sp.]|nr:hypothetical protein [Geobacter sp.]